MALISYASSPFKALAVPHIASGNCGVADDFTRYPKGGPVAGATEMMVTRDNRCLHLEVTCHEPSGKIVVAAPEKSAFNGDHIEFFFGALEPSPWLMQFAVNAAGATFDSTGRSELWQSQVTVGEDFWRANIIFPIELLRQNDLCVGFNMCRYAAERNEMSSWRRLERKFHEPENYGWLLLGDYSQVFLAKCGVLPEKAMTRDEFESEIAARQIPAQQVVHGPWLTNPAADAMTISFATAGFCGAFLEYAPIEAVGAWEEVPVGRRNGVLECDQRIRVVRLTGLQPDREYRYRIRTLHPVTAEPTYSPVYTFRTLDDCCQEFSFAVVTDLHSDTKMLEKFLALAPADECDMLVNLGDYLSCTCGADSYFDGFLDAEARWSKHSKPLTFIRGNHEQLGLFGGQFANILPNPTGRTYYSFKYGRTCFVVLDVGNDHPDPDDKTIDNQSMVAEERRWLADFVQSPAYLEAQWRIVLVHIPPVMDRYDGQLSNSLLQIFHGAAHKPHLILCGHEHKYFVVPPDSDQINFKRAGRQSRAIAAVPGLLIASGTDTMLKIQVSANQIAVEATDSNGQCFDSYLIP